MMSKRGSLSNIISMLNGRGDDEARAVEDAIAAESSKPLVAAIFGQTGVGKSSLTNALFGTSFAIDDVRPCTKEPQRHDGRDASGNLVTFWDLPGIGESSTADETYLDMYSRIARSSDVILWAFQADTRSIAVDSSAIKSIVNRLSEDERPSFLSRICIVLTKADTITTDSWIIAKDGCTALAQAGDETLCILRKKAEYFYSGLLGPYSALITSKVPVVPENIMAAAAPPPGFTLDNERRFLFHKGSLDEHTARSLSKAHPAWSAEIEQMLNATKAVACSSRLNFNLNEVKVLIADHACGTTYVRLGNILRAGNNKIHWTEIKNLGLPILFDIRSERKLFDPDDL